MSCCIKYDYNKQRTNRGRKMIREIVEGMIILIGGIIIGLFTYHVFLQDTTMFIPANIVHDNPYARGGEWDVTYILSNESTFLTEPSIDGYYLEGRIVFPEYIIINIKGKSVMDIIETFHHEMAHLYVFLDEEHFISNNKSSSWDEYKYYVGVNNPPIIHYN